MALQPTSISLPSGLTNGSSSNGAINGSDQAKVLVVGSLATAQGGSYISAVEAIERQNGAGTVEKQLWDRIVAGAASLEPKSFSAAHVVLAPEDFGAFEWQHLFGPIAAALKEGSEIKCVDAPGVEAALTQVGLSAVSTSSGQVTARALAANRSASVSLNLRKGPSKSAKASLWAFSAPPSDDAANLIDDDSLLTAEDLARPARITRPDCDVKRTRKACKNCTCGLRELELEEDDDLPNGVGAKGKDAALDEAVRDNEAKDSVRGAEGGVKKRKVKTGAVTSSCGNCYLGDAFRCSSCPYLGLPAFEPGQKVELTADMGDDL